MSGDGAPHPYFRKVGRAGETAAAKRAIVDRLVALGFSVKVADVALSGKGTHARVYAGDKETAARMAAAVPGASAQYSFVNVPRS